VIVYLIKRYFMKRPQRLGPKVTLEVAAAIAREISSKEQ